LVLERRSQKAFADQVRQNQAELAVPVAVMVSASVAAVILRMGALTIDALADDRST